MYDSLKVENKEQHYSILVVEDEYVNFTFVEILLLEKIGLPIKVHHAENGIEATKSIRKFRPDPPIIMQSAYTSKENKNQAIEVGCNDFMEKPISFNQLNNVLRSFLSVEAN